MYSGFSLLFSSLPGYFSYYIKRNILLYIYWYISLGIFLVFSLQNKGFYFIKEYNIFDFIILFSFVKYKSDKYFTYALAAQNTITAPTTANNTVIIPFRLNILLMSMNTLLMIRDILLITYYIHGRKWG